VKLLEGKIAIVTGAGSGIGKAIALPYAKEGAKVVVSDIAEKTAAETADEIKKGGGMAISVMADTGNPDACKNLVDQAVRQLGGLHIAVNNAGIAGPIKPLGEYPIDGWEKVISINLSGVFYGMRYQIPAMLASGGGSIVNISSILGKVATKGSAAYVSAKHGVPKRLPSNMQTRRSV
jgi:NAD(P)-dependent dehydrogenase (short-subunit alcohol dehydrogenase family)